MSTQENWEALEKAVEQGKETKPYVPVKFNAELGYELRSVGMVELAAANIQNEEFFDMLKGVSKEELKEVAYRRALSALYARCFSVIQQAGLDDFAGSIFAGTDVTTFDDQNNFAAWAQEKVPGALQFPVEFHPYTGKRAFVNIVQAPEYVTKVYGKSLSEVYLNSLHYQYTGHIVQTSHTEVAFIDCWIAAQHFPSFKVMKERLEWFQESIKTFNPQIDVDMTKAVTEAVSANVEAAQEAVEEHEVVIEETETEESDVMVETDIEVDEHDVEIDVENTEVEVDEKETHEEIEEF